MIRASVGLRRWRIGHTLARGAAAFVGGFDNRANWHIERNGEATLVDRLAPFSPSLLLDVGANVGEWSRLAAERLTTAQIHAFEPVPATAQRLRADTARHRDRITVHEIALGATEERRLLSTATSPALVSMLDHADPDSDQSVPVDVRTGDRFCADHGIEQVDVLKIDAEGADHLVLAGFERMLAARAIDVVQFEYGSWALRTKFLLRDFYELFEARGYLVGKLFPRGVDFGPYRRRWEDFQGLNFVAVSSRRADLVEALREG